MKAKELSITWRQFLRFGPCYERDELKSVREVAKRQERWTAIDILGVEEFPIADRLWLVLRPELIPEKMLHLLACDFADRALKRERKAGREPDARSWNAIKAKRLWVDGKASDDELFAARAAAVWAAVGAAQAAARAAESRWQLAQVRKVLRRMEVRG